MEFQPLVRPQPSQRGASCRSRVRERKPSTWIATGHWPFCGWSVQEKVVLAQLSREGRADPIGFRLGLGGWIFRLAYRSAGNLKVSNRQCRRSRARLGRGSSQPAWQEPSEPRKPRESGVKDRWMESGADWHPGQGGGLVSRRPAPHIPTQQPTARDPRVWMPRMISYKILRLLSR